MSIITKYILSGQLHEAKQALLDRANAVASLLLDHKKAELAYGIMESEEEEDQQLDELNKTIAGKYADDKKKRHAKSSGGKKDSVSVDGEKVKLGRKIKLEITEEDEEDLDEEKLDEVSTDLLRRYVKKAKVSRNKSINHVDAANKNLKVVPKKINGVAARKAVTSVLQKDKRQAHNTMMNRADGIHRAYDSIGRKKLKEEQLGKKKV